MKTVLTIAGSDSCGGAGIQADIKSISANGGYAMSVITAVTAQNTQGVFGIQDISPEMIESQIDVLFDDIKHIDAIKIGMVSKVESIKAIRRALDKVENIPPVILDPVMVSTSGSNLLSVDAKETLIKELFSISELITPNLHEAEALLGEKINSVEDMKKACIKLKTLGSKYVLVKGGHLNDEATDVLYDGKKFVLVGGEIIKTKNKHGTGCTLSSAIATNLAKGMTMEEAVKKAKEYITLAIQQNLDIGKGCGPVNHFPLLFKIL